MRGLSLREAEKNAWQARRLLGRMRGPAGGNWDGHPSAVFDFHQQNSQAQAQGDAIGDDDRPSHEQHAIDEPERHPCGEGAVHAQRDAAHIAGAEGFDRLRDEATGGEQGGKGADEVSHGYMLCY